MKTLTIKSFKESLSVELAALVYPVKNQLGASSRVEFWQELQNVSNSPYGAAAGFGGFIYYSDTVKFWRKNRQKITKYMNLLAWELGEKNALSLCQGFNGLKDYESEEIARALYGNYNSDLDQIYNVFAWFALEEVANRFADFEYENR